MSFSVDAAEPPRADSCLLTLTGARPRGAERQEDAQVVSGRQRWRGAPLRRRHGTTLHPLGVATRRSLKSVPSLLQERETKNGHYAYFSVDPFRAEKELQAQNQQSLHRYLDDWVGKQALPAVPNPSIEPPHHIFRRGKPAGQDAGKEVTPEEAVVAPPPELQEQQQQPAEQAPEHIPASGDAQEGVRPTRVSARLASPSAKRQAAVAAALEAKSHRRPSRAAGGKSKDAAAPEQPPASEVGVAPQEAAAAAELVPAAIAAPQPPAIPAPAPAAPAPAPAPAAAAAPAPAPAPAAPAAPAPALAPTPAAAAAPAPAPAAPAAAPEPVAAPKPVAQPSAPVSRHATRYGGVPRGTDTAAAAAAREDSGQLPMKRSASGAEITDGQRPQQRRNEKKQGQDPELQRAKQAVLAAALELRRPAEEEGAHRAKSRRLALAWAKAAPLPERDRVTAMSRDEEATWQALWEVKGTLERFLSAAEASTSGKGREESPGTSPKRTGKAAANRPGQKRGASGKATSPRGAGAASRAPGAALVSPEELLACLRTLGTIPWSLRSWTVLGLAPMLEQLRHLAADGQEDRGPAEMRGSWVKLLERMCTMLLEQWRQMFADNLAILCDKR